MNDSIREAFSGTAIALHGEDIDTDRIIPARYLKELTFAALGRHVFADERAAATAEGAVHPFDDPVHEGAQILLTARNFGCGSSREHAPQALSRWGIKVIVGVSFGEIFQGNAATIGLPCLTIDERDAAEARAAVDKDPASAVSVDLGTLRLTVGSESWPVAINEALRHQLRTGAWDTLAILGTGREQAEAKFAELPYLNGWRVAQAARPS
ncbi:MAG TPA: hypothetical protein VGX23_04995 [Actinocrinis sp.]|nr:hypothetical protein [Actinocrinis sp.]